MKIAIDISPVIYGTGVSVYTRRLVENLLKINKKDEYLLFGGSLRRRKDLLDIFPQSKVFPIPPTIADLLWNRLHILSVEKLIGDIDIFHSSDWTQPPSKAFKVTTVHDLIPVKFPKIIHPKIVDTHKRRLKWIKKEIDRVIVPSQSAFSDLVAYGIKSEKIRVIPEANNIKKARRKEVESVKKRYGISGNYILAIGSSLYKNIPNILDAFDLSSAGKDLKMVVIGKQTNTNLSSRRNVRFTGFVADQEYAALCTGAEVLTFPSLYEGFGIAILDGFACETPVVTSNISSMPEVAGEAAILVDPTDTRSIAQGIEEALSKPKTLIAKGKKQLSKYSWKKTAQKTLEVYREVLIS